MTEEVKFDSLDRFISEIGKAGIKKVAFSEVNERRAEQTDEAMLEVVVLRKVDILAYSGSTLYKYSEKTEDLDQIYEELVSRGFEVTRRNRNIT